MKRTTTGLSQSVQARLVRHAKQIDMEANVVLSRYAAERFLYRLSQSPHGERFVLKGALLMLVWLGERIRPTRDVDLLGLGDTSEERLKEVFGEVLDTDVEPDGFEFDPSSIRVEPIRVEDPYGGVRATFFGFLGSARVPVQVDVGVGDSVEPEPELLEYPSLLELPRPRLRAYRPETAIAEKLHAIVTLGEANSRMRDYFDLHALASREAFDGAVLVAAVRATFERRHTPLPAEPPIGLTADFAGIAGKEAQWSAYLRKNAIRGAPESLAAAIVKIREFLGPIIDAARASKGFAKTWLPGGPWS